MFYTFEGNNVLYSAKKFFNITYLFKSICIMHGLGVYLTIYQTGSQQFETKARVTIYK